MAGCTVSTSVSLCLVVLSSVGVADNLYGGDYSVDMLGSHDALEQILDRITSLDDRFTTLEQRMTSLEQHVGRVQESVDTLTLQSVAGARQVLHDLSAVCAELSSLSDVTTMSAPGTSDVTPPTTQKNRGSPFRIRRVNKTETDDAYQVTFEYEASAEPAVYLQLKYDSSPFPVKPKQQGVAEVQVAKSPESLLPLVIFVSSQVETRVLLSVTKNVSSMVMPFFNFTVLQGADVTFAKGDNVTLDFLLKMEDNEDSRLTEDVSPTILVRSDTQNNVVNSYSQPEAGGAPTPGPVASVSISLRTDRRPNGDLSGTAVLSSTTLDVDGIVEFHVNAYHPFGCHGECLVYYIASVHSVKVHREDHPSPFPPHFIGFLHSHRHPSPTGFVCALSRGDCHLSCKAVGNGPADVTITRLLPHGDVKATNDASMAGGYWGLSQLFLENVTMSDAGDYLCKARAVETRETIRQTLTLAVVEAPEINEELSTVTKFHNGSLLLTCIAQGNPAPNVSFVSSSSSSPYSSTFYVTTDHIDVSMTRVNNVTTRGDLFVPDPDTAGIPLAVECRASNSLGMTPPLSGLHDSHVLHVPDHGDSHDQYYG